MTDFVVDLDIPIVNTHGTDDEVALAQLGAATVNLWHALTPQLRDDLLSTAERIAGVRQIEDCQSRLARLIEHNARKVD